MEKFSMQHFIFTFLVGLLPLATIFQANPAITQGIEPDNTREAMGAVVPNQPIKIKVINKSEIEVDIISQLTLPPSNQRIAKPGTSVSFGRLHTNFLPPPIELSIFPKDNDIILEDLELVVKNNEIIVTVKAEQGVSGGLRNLRVNPSGKIYLF